MANAELKALIVSPDAKTAALLVHLFGDLGVAAQVCADHASACERFLQAKFEAVAVDLDCILERIPFVQHLRQSRANRSAVVLAIATNYPAKKRATEHGARFVVERPLVASRIARVLWASYGLMLQDRRRYFRLAVELPVSVRTSAGAEFQCKTINVSAEGMAVRTPCPMQVGETVGVVFSISSPGPLMIAKGTVIWDDKHGRCGLRLSFAYSADKDQISEWLDSEFDTGARPPFSEPEC
jgi:CheY-like chemotaxis protein